MVPHICAAPVISILAALAFVSGSGYCLRLWLLSSALAFVSGSWLRPRGAKDKMEKEKKCHNPLQVRVLYQWKANHFVEPLSSFLSINITLMNLFQKVIFHWIFSHKCAVAFIIYKWKIVCLNNKTFFYSTFWIWKFLFTKMSKIKLFIKTLYDFFCFNT